MIIPHKSIENIERKTKLDPLAWWTAIIILVILIVVFLFQYLVSNPLFQSEWNLEWYRRLLYFDYMFILFVSATAVILGSAIIIIAHRKKKYLGAGVLVGGILFGAIWIYYFKRIFEKPPFAGSFYDALTMVIATILGFMVVVGLVFIITVSFRKTMEKKDI